MSSGKCPRCGSCGMPMSQISDRGGGKSDSEFCVHCSNEDGELVMSFDDVVAYYTNDFVKRRGLDTTVARTLAEQMVSKLPAWSS